MSFFLQLFLTGLCQGAIYALIAYGFNVTFWTVKVVNFAHGSCLMIAVMVSLAAFNAGMPLAIAVALGIAFTAALVGVLERIAVRPVLSRGGGMGWVVSTLGAGIVLQAIASLVWGTQTRAFPPILFETTDYLAVAGIQLSLQMVLILAVALLVMLIIETLLRFSVWGKVLRATAFDPESARMRGIPVQQVVTLSFVASGALAGLAGVLIAPVSGIDPAFGLHLMIKGFAAAVIGGLGSSLGALVGGLAVGIIELLVGGYISTAWRNGVVFLLLLLVLVVQPRGLLGLKQTVKA
ncbi:MAG: branched-chain amino acid ABC transporter permease [Lautropia sp.]